MFGVYIHIPFCVKKCKYCDFNSFKMNLCDKKRYLDDLKKEIKMYSDKCADRIVDTIFFGGGTPSILSCDEIESLMKCVKDSFN